MGSWPESLGGFRNAYDVPHGGGRLGVFHGDGLGIGRARRDRCVQGRAQGFQRSAPVESKGSGTLTATYDTGSKSLNYTANYSGLSGDATAAHFHGPAAAGQNAGVAVPVTGSAATPIKGSATLTDAQATDLTAGRWYFNIHTAANKGGEIRGQVVKGK